MFKQIFEKLEEKDIQAGYQRYIETKAVRFGRIVAFLIILVVPFFIFIDYRVVVNTEHEKELPLHFFWRGIPLVCAVLFLGLSLFFQRKNYLSSEPQVMRPFLNRLFLKMSLAINHITLLLFSIMVMMVGLYSTTGYYQFVASTNAFLLVILICFVSSLGGLRKILFIYSLPAFLYISIMFFREQQIPLRMSNQLAAIFILTIFAHYQEKLRYEEFKARKISEHETNRSNILLSLILPEKIIKEFQEAGTSEPIQYDSVTIVFTDFVNFTKISETFTPKELLLELDLIFSSFDSILEKYKLQKIKTIGDAYMFAGGIPSPSLTHAEDCIQCAQEMIAYMETYIQNKKEKGIPFWEIRIGINTGKVIAGIIGNKTFAYDIWGDTVNVASRMESASESGKINISESTYTQVKDMFSFRYRGRIPIKGKGEMNMYFLLS